jgi:hypothetical protein
MNNTFSYKLINLTTSWIAISLSEMVSADFNYDVYIDYSDCQAESKYQVMCL